MRTFCLALVVIGVALTATEAKIPKHKRLLGLNGVVGNLLEVDLVSNILGNNLLDQILGENLLGGLLEDDVLNTLMNSEEGLIQVLLGPGGVVEKVLERLFAAPVLGAGPVLQGFLSSTMDLLVEWLNVLNETTMTLAEQLASALEGVDLNDTDALNAVFDNLNLGDLCMAINLLPEIGMVREAAMNYCQTTVDLIF